MKRFIQSLLLIVTCAFASTATAEEMILDFIEMSTGNEGAQTNPWVIPLEGFYEGVTVVVTTSSLPYLDDGVGLGVCEIPDGNCAGSPLDNLNTGEWVTFTFFLGEETVGLEGLIFKVNNLDSSDDLLGTVNLVVNDVDWEATDENNSYNVGEAVASYTLTSLGGEVYLDGLFVEELLPPAEIPTPEVPEPTNIALMALGLMAILVSKKKVMK